MDPTTFCNTVAEVLVDRVEAVKMLRAQADVLEAHPLMSPKATVQPLVLSRWDELDWQRWDDKPVEFLADKARAFKQGQPVGAVQKVVDDYHYKVELHVPGLVRPLVKALVPVEQTCEYVETGEVERVASVVVPDDVAEAYTVYEDKPVMERVCPKLIIDGWGGDA